MNRLVRRPAAGRLHSAFDHVTHLSSRLLPDRPRPDRLRDAGDRLGAADASSAHAPRAPEAAATGAGAG